MAKFSLCTYNVHHCYTGAGKYSFEQIIEVLSDLKPDILCLQVKYSFQHSSNLIDVY